MPIRTSPRSAPASTGLNALDRLQRANDRVVFGSGAPAAQPAAGVTAVILCCSELEPTRVFDLPLTELAVVQTPGHALVDGALPSIVFAIECERVELVLVLGHTKCGVLACVSS